MSKTSSFLRFMVFFMSYCRFILGFQGDLHVSDLGAKTRLFLHFMDIFMSYCPQFWYYRAIYMFWIFDQNHVLFAIYGNFHEILPTVLGFQGDLHVSELLPKTRLFCI